MRILHYTIRMVAAMACLAVMTFTASCSSDDDYYDQLPLPVSDSLSGFWQGVDAQTYWFLTKDTTAYQHSIANRMLHFSLDAAGSNTGTITLYEYTPIPQKWTQSFSTPFTTDGNNIVVKRSGTADTLKMLARVEEYLTFSYSNSTRTSNAVFYKVPANYDALNDLGTIYAKEYFYDDQMSDYSAEDSTGYWILNFEGDYNPETDEILNYNDLSDKSLILSFYNSIFEFFTQDNIEVNLSEGTYYTDHDYLELDVKKEDLSSADDEMKELITNLTTKYKVIRKFDTALDGNSSGMYFDLIVKLDDKYDHIYRFVWSHGSINASFDQLREVLKNL